MSLGSIGANDEQDIGVFNLVKGICGRSAAKTCSKTGYRRSMTDSRTVVHIVGAEHRPCELLHKVVLLIGAPGRGECSQRIRTIFIFDLSEPLGDKIECFIPASLLKSAVASYQGSGQTIGMVDDLLQAKMAFNACLPTIYRAISVWADRDNSAIIDTEI